LTHATGNGGTFGHPDAVFVTVKRHRKFHVKRVTDNGAVGNGEGEKAEG
jgi:hypothetical protein